MFAEMGAFHQSICDGFLTPEPEPTPMIKNLFFLLVALVSFPILAAETPDHSMMLMQHGSTAMAAQADPHRQALTVRTSALMAMLEREGSLASTVRTTADFKPAANATTRVFNVTATNAGNFGFIWTEASPTELNPTVTVNQGDDITIKVHSANGAVHSFNMEQYLPDTTEITPTVHTFHFVASQVGSFIYFCNVPTCGIGHINMNGEFVVNAATTTPPSITAIAPASGAASGGTSVTISGSNFTSPVQVSFGGVAAVSVTFNSSSSITAVAPGGTAGPVEVKVTNPDGTSATSTFNYVAAPSITSIAPSSGSSAGGTPITIAGTGFQSGATVKVGGVAATSVSLLGSTTITATTPAHATGDQTSVAVDVVVSNPDGQSATTSNGFTYNAPPVSVLKANVVMVSSGPVSGGTLVTILGSGFTGGGLTVTFGGVPATNIVIANDTTATAVTPAHAAGLVDVVVTKQGSSATATAAFRYTDGAPSGPRKREARH
jgi:IPT/TIG domain